MIYTVTLNPSIDIFMEVDSIEFGKKMHAKNSFTLPGGKALNVSRVLQQLNIPTKATGFLGGHPGAFIKEWLDEEDILTDFVEIQDENRRNVKLLVDSNETTINEVGPNVTHEEVGELLHFLSRVTEGDTIVMGGSIPKMDDQTDYDIYERMVSIAKANRAQFIANIPPEYLVKVIKANPILVKPNVSDLEVIFNTKIENREQLTYYGKQLIEMGAKYAIVSYGAEGSMFFNNNGDSYIADKIHTENVVNSTACRDAMIGGFIGTYVRTSDPVESYKMAVAAATATARVRDLPNRSEIESILPQVNITKL
jgi:1-phosphofructokinase